MSRSKNILKNIINLILICILIFSTYHIYIKLSNYKKDEKTYLEIQKIAQTNYPYNKLNPPNDYSTSNKLDVVNDDSTSTKLKSINDDYQFWIKINNTNIDYPVVQGQDNDYYLDRDFNKNNSISGSIFMDYRNDFEKDQNVIIYGHYMRNKTMFAQLGNFKNTDFFKDNNKIIISKDNKNYIYQVFSVYVSSANGNYIIPSFSSDDEYMNYLNNIQSKSLNSSNITLSPEDKILTLSTCSYEFEDARTVIHAKLISIK